MLGNKNRFLCTCEQSLKELPKLKSLLNKLLIEIEHR
jgi:hypothetical protein